MKVFLKILFFITLIGLVGCSPAPGTSKLKVSVAAVTGSAQFPGGLYLMGTHDKGKKFIRVIRATDTIELELENGKWSFASIGWDSQSEHFEGNSYCGLQRGVELNGNEIALDLQANKENCNSKIFGTQVFNNQFYPLQFHTCSDIQDYILKGETIPNNFECGPSNSKEMFSGGLKSFKISLKQFTEDGALKEGLSSKCINDSDTNAKELSAIKLPHGSPYIQLPYEIKGYGGYGCNEGDLLSRYSFLNGFVDPAGKGLAIDAPDSTGKILNVYLHSDICSPAQVGASDFAATTGTTHLICSQAHFENIGQSPSTAMDTFILGEDIEFSGGNTSISGFQGKLKGDWHTISGGSRPLFDDISVPSGGVLEIEELIIKNFDIDISSGAEGNGFGILAGKLIANGSGKEARISDIEIKNSKIKVSDSSGITESFVGGLIGLINFKNAGAEENAEIRNIKSFAIVDGLGEQDIRVGGLIGKAISDADSGDIRIEYNQVGVNNPENLQDLSGMVPIVGYRRVGGLVGSAEFVEIREGNKVIVSLQAENAIGGLVGEARTQTNIENSQSNMIFTHLPGFNSVSLVGGIAGDLTNNGEYYFSGVVSRIDIPEPLGNIQTISSLGGIIGSAVSINSGGSSNGVWVKNSRAYITAKVNGSKHGGIIGHFKDSSGASTPNCEIRSSVAMGRLTVKENNNASNTKKGGFIGDAEKISVILSITDMDKIEGFNSVGGGYGWSTAAKIEESFLNTEIECLSSGSVYCGGVIGKQVSAVGDTPLYSKIKSQVEMSVPNISPGSCGAYFCGEVIGQNQQAGLSFEESIIFGEISSVMQGDSDHTCGGGNCAVGAMGNIANTVLSSEVSCGPLGTEFQSDTNCELVFERKWKKYGQFNFADPAGNYSKLYRAGGLIEPFPIDNELAWSSIGEDKFLMDKFFILENPLDFSGEPFISIGSLNNPFKGGIIPNGKKINKVTFVASALKPGLFPRTEGAEIGRYGDPLTLVEPRLNCGTHGECGPIGTALETNVRMVIQNGEITASSDNIGGLIGRSLSDNYISESGFEGTIDTTGNNVGGLVGSHSGVLKKLQISESFVRAAKLIGSENIGGFLGFLSGSGPIAKAEKSYVVIDPKNENGNYDFGQGGTGEIAGFVGYAAGGTSVEADTVYIDTRNANDGGNVDSIVGISSSTSPSTDKYFIVHSGVYSYPDTNGGPNGNVGHPKDLNSNDFSREDAHDDWAMDGVSLKLAWEVYGHKD